MQPWESAVRVRGGKHVKLCGPGVHLKIPAYDSVYVHNVRRYSSTLPAITLSSADGRVFVASCMLSYVVTDVLKMHTSVNNPSGVLQQRILQKMSEFFISSSGQQVNPASLQTFVSSIKSDDLGVGDIEVSVANFASVTTVRVINDEMHSRWHDSGPDVEKKLGDKS